MTCNLDVPSCGIRGRPIQVLFLIQNANKEEMLNFNVRHGLMPEPGGWYVRRRNEALSHMDYQDMSWHKLLTCGIAEW